MTIWTADKQNPPAILLCILLSLAAIAYVCRGTEQLVFPHSQSAAKDLRTNWEETHHFVRGISPYASLSPYPPWSFPSNVAFYWPDWPAVRIYWAGINLAALAVMCIWANGLTPDLHGSTKWVMPLSIPAIAVVSTGMGLGQNAIVYTALLILVLVFIERDRQVYAGIALAVAASKISVALPFFLPLLLQRKWTALAASAVWMCGSWMVTSAVIHQSPIECLRLWVLSARRFEAVEYGPVSILHRAGFGSVLVAPLWAIVSLGTYSVCAFQYRRLRMFSLFALAATVGRIWTYHRLYDDFMMAIPLIACGEAWFRLQRPVAGPCFLALGATLWLPSKFVDHSVVVQFANVLIWIVVAASMLAHERPAVPPGDTSRSRRSSGYA